MINDLDIAGMELWKYVDDITLTDVVRKGGVSRAQEAVDENIWKRLRTSEAC